MKFAMATNEILVWAKALRVYVKISLLGHHRAVTKMSPKICHQNVQQMSLRNVTGLSPTPFDQIAVRVWL